MLAERLHPEPIPSLTETPSQREGVHRTASETTLTGVNRSILNRCQGRFERRRRECGERHQPGSENDVQPKFTTAQGR
jgi:hypothetical protein